MGVLAIQPSYGLSGLDRSGFGSRRPVAKQLLAVLAAVACVAPFIADGTTLLASSSPAVNQNPTTSSTASKTSTSTSATPQGNSITSSQGSVAQFGNNGQVNFKLTNGAGSWGIQPVAFGGSHLSPLSPGPLLHNGSTISEVLGPISSTYRGTGSSIEQLFTVPKAPVDDAGTFTMDMRTSGSLRPVLSRHDFVEALAFVNEVGELAEAAGHHPGIELHWNTVTLRLSTHSLGGVTDAALNLARAIDIIS